MKPFGTILVLALVAIQMGCSTAPVDEKSIQIYRGFSLVDVGTQKIYGPFNLQGQVNIKGTVYSIEPHTRESASAILLDRIILPGCVFNDANLIDVLSMLGAETHSGAAHPRLNIVYDGPKPVDSTVSVRLDLVSIREALRVICTLTDHEYEAGRDGIIWVRPKD